MPDWLIALCWVWAGGSVGFMFGGMLARRSPLPLYVQCPRCKRTRLVRMQVDA
jgi:hypothetical protein